MTTKMKILFLCTAHNSLSQRLYLELSALGHDISIEYALSDQIMLDAVTLFAPHLIICPFLTTRVPKEIYNNWMTLIVHPGPPGDSGPSAIDWVLMGDDGTIDDAADLLSSLNGNIKSQGRSHWGVTVLQAIEDFDAGPVWAFDQFPIDIDQPGLTKSALYRQHITQAAVSATRAAISRLQLMSRTFDPSHEFDLPFSPRLQADVSWKQRSVATDQTFQGGRLHHRPLLPAASRDFDVRIHSAKQISRRIRSADSQPGVASSLFGPKLYVYGGMIEDNVEGREGASLGLCPIQILGIRNEALCVATVDGRGIWITHLRRLKGKNPTLFPKVSAVFCLLELGILDPLQAKKLEWPESSKWSLAKSSTFQEVWVDVEPSIGGKKIAYLHFEFYNGAMSTNQCSHLIDAMNYILSQSTEVDPIQAVVLMGGAYFSNGIALNVIEASSDPATESWLNINRIDDVVQMLLLDFPSHNILTVAAMRGNAAAGGVALAAACDVVIAGAEIVLNPAYRAIGLHGSEYHSLSYFGRCGPEGARRLLRDMKPLSPTEARRMRLVDYVFPGTGEALDDCIRSHVALLVAPGCLRQAFWKARIGCTPDKINLARAQELGEMSKDFWSARSVRYHSRRFAFTRKIKPDKTPYRFATHRRLSDQTLLNEEETDRFDDVEYFRTLAEEDLLTRLREKLIGDLPMPKSERDVPLQLPGPTESLTPPLSPPGKAFSADSPQAKVEEPQMLFPCYYKPVSDLPTPP